MILDKLGVKSNLQFDKKRHSYDISVSGKNAKKIFDNKEYRKKCFQEHGVVTDQWIFVPVLKIEKCRYKGKKYDLTIGENKSYYITEFLVHNSGHEGFNVPLIEAFSCGVPVVTTGLANHKEIVGGTGCEEFLVRASEVVGVVNDVQAVKVPKAELLYGKLKLLLEDPVKRKVLGEKGRNKVLEEYELWRNMVKWHKLFEELCPQDYSMETEQAKRLLQT